MLAGLTIRCFRGEKIDRKVSDAVAAQHNTVAGDSGRFVKQIISKNALKCIEEVAGEARRWFDSVTLPGFQEGERMFNTVGFFSIVEGLNQQEAKFVEAREHIIQIYPDLIAEARTRLKSLFDPNDYPTTQVLRDSFEFRFRMKPMPDTTNWFLEGVGDEMERIRTQTEHDINKTISERIASAYQRVIRRTSELASKLEGYGVDPESGKTVGKFHDTLVENVRELMAVLPVLNVTNDPGLAELAVEMQSLVRHDAKALRADPGFRMTVAEEARRVAARAEALLG